MERSRQAYPWLRPFGVGVTLLAATAAIGGLVWQLAGESNADLTVPQARDRQVALMVGTLMEGQHLSEHRLDDEVSQRALDAFLDQLDPMKLYFYAEDIEEFQAHRNLIDNDLQEGDISFAYTVFNRFLERVEERIVLVGELLATEHDFTVDEHITVKPEELSYPTTAAEAAERWRLRVKYDLLILKLDNTEGTEAIDRLTRRYRSFASRMRQFDSDELLEMYLTAFTTSFDPHTTYMSPSTLENFNISMSLQLDGIGAGLQLVDGYTVITKIIPGGAADRHGELQVNDRIIAVAQADDETFTEVIDMKLGDVVDKIRGPAGTIVRLKVIPEGGGETRELIITRARIELSDSEARGEVIERGTKADGTPYRIGVIDLPSFYMDMPAARAGREDYKSTTRDVRVILESFNEQNVDSVVLDLRRNGGGSLTEAINLTGLFIDVGPVVQVKDSAGRVQHYDDLDRGMAWEGPLVVVTSRFSASASEILAGAIQDYRRGIIVGDESTHGKGTVQSLLDLGRQLFSVPNPPNMGALKITMQQFYRPGGDSTQLRGVVADVAIPSMSQHMEGISEGDLDYAVDFDRVPGSVFSTYPMVSNPILEQLRTAAQTRIAASEEWAELQQSIDRYIEQKGRSVVTLNEEQFLAERAELNAEDEDQRQIEETQNGTSDGDHIVELDFYFNEVLQIAVDYTEALEESDVALAN